MVGVHAPFIDNNNNSEAFPMGPDFSSLLWQFGGSMHFIPLLGGGHVVHTCALLILVFRTWYFFFFNPPADW